jgi:hypothetical protein
LSGLATVTSLCCLRRGTSVSQPRLALRSLRNDRHDRTSGMVARQVRCCGQQCPLLTREERQLLWRAAAVRVERVVAQLGAWQCEHGGVTNAKLQSTQTDTCNSPMV